MIFGKTYNQEQRERDKKTGAWFAWYPVRLERGQWIWWQQVNRVRRGTRDFVWYNYFEIKID